MAGERDPDMVTIVTARDIIQAEFYKSLLVSQDIPALILDENSETLGMPMSILNQGVPVLVPAQFKAEAERVIGEHGPIDEAELTRQAEATSEE